ILLLVLNRIPFFKIRLSEEEEELGTDAAQIGEFTYQDSRVYIPEPVRSIKSISGAKTSKSNELDADAVPYPK
ncbi:hypothetical protein WICPIJ_008579, partial [Wickerhamomyces pijperi]